jgi:hypothetical protein
MFKLKSIDGQLDLTMFDLKALTDKANQTAKEIENHNNQVREHFLELVNDYFIKINSIMIGELNLKPFVKNSSYMSYSCGLFYNIEFGHGGASVSITFICPREGEKLSYDFSGTIKVYKNWKGYLGGKSFEYPLESVAQIFEVGADVFKVHIIQRDVEDYERRRELQLMLDY